MLVLVLVPGSNSLIIVHYPESDQIERNIQRLRGEETTRPAPAPGTVLYAAESLIENHHENCALCAMTAMSNLHITAGYCWLAPC